MSFQFSNNIIQIIILSSIVVLVRSIEPRYIQVPKIILCYNCIIQESHDFIFCPDVSGDGNYNSGHMFSIFFADHATCATQMLLVHSSESVKIFLVIIRI